MIIINQGKTGIINFDRVSNIYIRKNRIEYQCPDIEDFYGILGIYKTEEKAKEVLRDIKYCYMYKQYDDGEEVNKVFEMPEE